MTNDSIPKNTARPRDDLSIEKVDDNLLILDKQNQKIHQLNSQASMIWSQLELGCAPLDIATEMTKQYDVTLDTALKDVSETLAEFSALNLLQTDGEDQAASLSN
jgi:hypothetical protein